MRFQRSDITDVIASLNDYRQVQQDYADMVAFVGGESTECSSCQKIIPSVFLQDGKCANCWSGDYEQLKTIIANLHTYSAIWLGLPCHESSTRHYHDEDRYDRHSKDKPKKRIRNISF